MVWGFMVFHGFQVGLRSTQVWMDYSNAFWHLHNQGPVSHTSDSLCSESLSSGGKKTYDVRRSMISSSCGHKPYGFVGSVLSDGTDRYKTLDLHHVVVRGCFWGVT